MLSFSIRYRGKIIKKHLFDNNNKKSTRIDCLLLLYTNSISDHCGLEKFG